LNRTKTTAFPTLLSFAHELADLSGRAILPYFRKPIPVDNKAGRGQFDPVTAADRAAERAIGRLIGKTYPDHGIIGEEFGEAGSEARFRWFIDPLDGTRAFITGTPMWGTLIGLMDANAPVLGLMDQPYTRERFWSAASASYARTGSGKSRRIRTRSCPRLERAVLMTTSPDLFASGREMEKFDRIKSAALMTRYGGDCYAYCLLASGLVDLVVEAGLKSYDVVALIPIIERAGGRMTAWDGGPAAAGGRIVAAGDPELHERVLKLLN
jgi:myo-inositol-1(or 4)-monophosphatase